MLKRVLLTTLLVALALFGAPLSASALVSETPAPRYPDFNGSVYTIAHSGKVVYVGGSFRRVTGPNGTFKRRGAAAFNLRTGRVLQWNPRVRGTVRDIAVAREGVYLAGTFSRVQGKPRRNLARVSATGGGKLHAYKVRVDGQIHTVDLAKRKLFMGGEFTRVNGFKRTRLASLSRKRATLSEWRPRVDDVVFDLDSTKAGVYIAGRFRKVNGDRQSRYLDLLSGKGRGTAVATFDAGVTRQLLDIVVAGTRIYAAEAGNNGGGLSAVVRRTGRQLWEKRLDGDVQAVTAIGSEIYIGGHFASVCPDDNQNASGRCLSNGAVPRERTAAYNPAGDLLDWEAPMDSEIGVRNLHVIEGRLLAGGDFTTTSGVSTGRLAVFR